MDKELLRLVIIAIGAIVIIGMLIWSFFKNRNQKRSIDFYDKGNPLDNIDESLILDTENDDFDIVPIGSALDEDQAEDPITAASRPKQEVKQATKPAQPVQNEQKAPVKKQDIPQIIQFSIVAVADEGFNGIDLVHAFEKVGLVYGSMKVFERLDEQRRVDFAVASMVEPGIFPDTELESFQSPGIVFFMQPQELDDPLPIFDEFIKTINYLAKTLDGAMWDHNRQPLTNETIQHFRMLLK